jgi:hypothetical protein
MRVDILAQAPTPIIHIVSLAFVARVVQPRLHAIGIVECADIFTILYVRLLAYYALVSGWVYGIAVWVLAKPFTIKHVGLCAVCAFLLCHLCAIWRVLFAYSYIIIISSIIVSISIVSIIGIYIAI